MINRLVVLQAEVQVDYAEDAWMLQFQTDSNPLNLLLQDVLGQAKDGANSEIIFYLQVNIKCLASG